MLRIVPLLALAGIGLATLFASQPQSQVAIGPAKPVPVGCKNNLKVEPVLNVDVTGGTLAGPFHRRLTVYNNGLATVSKDIDSVFGGPDIDADYTYVSAAAVSQLQSDLLTSGAFGLCDQSIIVFDVPLTTVTVFSGTTDAKAHTFSYWLGSGSYSGVQGVVSSFFSTHFPGF